MQFTTKKRTLFLVIASIYASICLWKLLAHHMFYIVLQSMFLCWLAALLVMVLVFAVSYKKHRYDYVDAGWGVSFIAVALTVFWMGVVPHQRFEPVRLLALGLVVLWGLRLSWHILRRILASSQEDPRHVELRAAWHQVTPIKIFGRMFLVQSILVTFVSVPVIHILLSKKAEWMSWTTAGLIVWVLGFACEFVADAQLKTFTSSSQNRGKLLRTGLRTYSRHPNYFGEIVLWWGMAIIALGIPHGWVGAGGAALISFLIVYVSGIPPAERRSASKLGWEEYKRTTPALVPFVWRWL
ncbi:MAG: hypothetical protein QG629_827 [Patescibacteria group bacterium]|nr:DUF1295 domain-containing protein [Candidatus Saccharibacteria bacterium]MDQ5963744.1 hypothetical protein [Patescibacteria group bacterium]